MPHLSSTPIFHFRRTQIAWQSHANGDRRSSFLPSFRSNYVPRTDKVFYGLATKSGCADKKRKEETENGFDRSSRRLITVYDDIFGRRVFYWVDVSTDTIRSIKLIRPSDRLPEVNGFLVLVARVWLKPFLCRVSNCKLNKKAGRRSKERMGIG